MAITRTVFVLCIIGLCVGAGPASAKDRPKYDHWHWSSGKGSAHLVGGVAVVADKNDLRVVVRGNDQFRRIGLIVLPAPNA